MVLELNQQERLYFQHFVDDTSTYLFKNDSFFSKATSIYEASSVTSASSYVSVQNYAPFFWKVTALQESQTSICVRHAIVALGALGKSVYTSNLDHHHMDTSQGPHREFALQQYQKAIRGLRESITGLNHEVEPRTTLISCLVLACFDIFIGNVGFAIQHIRYARDILCSSNPSGTPHCAASPDNPTDHLTNLFLRLDMQALLSIGTDSDRTYINLAATTPEIYVPEQFSNLDEAKDFRSPMMWEVFYFLYRTYFYNVVPREAIPEDVVQQRDYLIERINTFHARVDSLLQEAQPDHSIHPLRRPAAVKMYTTAGLIRLRASLNAPETDCDPLLPHFEFLLSFMRDTIKYEASMTSGRFILSSLLNQLTQDSGGETFTFEGRTIVQLFLIATKCRHPALRREAIALLLSSHRRESMFDSLLAGQVAAWMMDLEEEGMAEFGHIPEHARAWGECIMLDLHAKRAIVKCRQNVKEGGWRERETVIAW